MWQFLSHRPLDELTPTMFSIEPDVVGGVVISIARPTMILQFNPMQAREVAKRIRECSNALDPAKLSPKQLKRRAKTG